MDELRVVVPRPVVDDPREDERVVVPSFPVFEVVVPRDPDSVVDRVVVPRDDVPVDERVVVPRDDDEPEEERVVVPRPVSVFEVDVVPLEVGLDVVPREVARPVSDDPLVTARPLLERVAVFPEVTPLDPRTTVLV